MRGYHCMISSSKAFEKIRKSCISFLCSSYFFLPWNGPLKLLAIVSSAVTNVTSIIFLSHFPLIIPLPGSQGLKTL